MCLITVSWVLCSLRLKHTWFDTARPGSADRRSFPPGAALPDQEGHTQEEHRFSLPLPASGKAATSCHSRTLLVPEWTCCIHIPSQPSSPNLPSMTCDHIFLRNFMTISAGRRCFVTILIQVPSHLYCSAGSWGALPQPVWTGSEIA